MAEQVAALDAALVEQLHQLDRIVAGGRMIDRQLGRAAIARRVPCEHPEARREGVDLMFERAAGRADAMQQHEGRRIRFARPLLDGGEAHAAT